MSYKLEPKLYWKNIFYRAADSTKGDGTIYARATSCIVNRTNKTVALASASYHCLSDSTTGDYHDWDGYSLIFPATGRRYTIRKWQDTTADLVDYPSSNDTGAVEIRIGLFENAFDREYHLDQVADLKLWTKFKGNAANIDQNLYAFLPNLIRDGGFEECSKHTLSSPWTFNYGASGWDIDTTNQLGTFGALYTDDATDSFMWQTLEPLEKDRTYKLTFLKSCLEGTGTNVGRIEIENKVTGAHILGYTFSATTTEAWDSTEVTLTFDTRSAIIKVWGLGESGTWGTATHLAVDELYLFEKVEAERLIISGHKLGDYTDATTVSGLYCHPNRTNFLWATESKALHGLTNYGEDTILNTMDTTGTYPIYRLHLSAVTGITHEIDELFLGSVLPFILKKGSVDTHQEKVKEVVNTTEGGVSFIHPKYSKKRFKDNIFFLTDSAYQEYFDLWNQWAIDGHPLWFCWDEDAHSDEIWLGILKRAWRFKFKYLPNEYREGVIDIEEAK